MFFQLLYIHLFRPFLKYNQESSPLPKNVSPRRLCTQAATAISKLLRLYKRSHGLRQICNIAVYIAHSACTIHLLNLPDKNAKRDITHGVKHLEEIAESWLCARRTLAILSTLSRQWKVDLPDEAVSVFARTDVKFADWSQEIHAQTPRSSISSPAMSPPPRAVIQPSPNFFNITASSSGASVPASLLHNMGSPDLPPNSAAELQRSIHQRQLSQTTIDTPAGSQPSAVTSTGSPSALFGGVEQLLREGQDWWVKDQNQLAAGFGHWPRDMDHVAWLAANGPHGPNGGIPLGTPTTVHPLQPPQQQQQQQQQAPFSNNNEDYSGLFTTVNGNNGAFNGIDSYPNENEWYL
jgi:hypothetical protein